MPIQEDLTLYNKLIVNIVRDNDKLEIIHNDGSVDRLTIEEQDPDFEEIDTDSKNYVKNTNSIYNVQSLNDITNQIPLDIAFLSDYSRYIWTGSEWIKIKRDVVDLSTEVIVEKYINGYRYSKDSVRYMNGHLFMATDDTDTSPVQYSSDWVLISELDLFINRCEVTTPKLFGYFDVSGSPYVYKVLEITDLNTFQQYFNQNDRSGYSDLLEDSEGIYLSAKDSNVSEMNYWRNLDNSKIKIVGLMIDGKVVKADSVGQIKLELGDEDAYLYINDYKSDYNDVLLEEYTIEPNEHEYSTSEDDIEIQVDTRAIEQTYDKINLRFKYDNDKDLSRHRLSKITIIYEEKE